MTSEISVPLLVALIGLGVAMGRRGWLLAAAAAGLGAGWTVRATERAPVVSGRVLEGSVRVSSPWRAHPEEPESLVATGQIVTARQGIESWAGAEPVRLSWGGSPGDAALPELGETVSLRAVLTEPQGFANRRPVRTGWRRVRLEPGAVVRPMLAGDPLARASVRARAIVDAAAPRSAIDRPGIALARAMLLSDTSGFPDAWLRGFRRTGLSHLLAVSGFNVTWLVVLVLWIWPARPRWLRAVVAWVTVGAYLLAVGGLSPVTRAAAMSVVATLAIWSQRPPAVAQALALAGCACLLVAPESVAEVSFQLTYAATAGLVTAAPVLAHGRGAAPATVVGALAAATVVGQLMTWPWAFAVFGQFQALGLAYNLAAAPWAVLTFMVAAGTVVVAMVLPGALPVCWAALDLLAAPLGWIATPGPIPGFLLLAPAPVAVVATGLMAAAALWRPGRWLWHAAWCVPLAVVLGDRILAPAPPANAARALALDVGQGDATLLQDASASLLVDGGGWPRGDFGGRVLGPALRAEGVRALDVAVVSHADLDHCRGVADLADLMPIREVWMDRFTAASSCGERLRRAVPRAESSLERGMILRRGAWVVEVLWPPGDAWTPRSSNDASLVLRASRGEVSVLLAGDASERVEREVALGGGLAARLLKVSHHGSGSSSLAPFLDRVAPRWAWISCGRSNRYGHPHRGALSRLGATGASILRTDLDGAVEWSWREGGTPRISMPRSPADTVDR